VSASIALNAPVVLEKTERANGFRPVDRRVARAGGELRFAATSIERLPFDLSVLDAGGVFINVDAANFGLLVTSTVAVPIAGKLSDQLGRKPPAMLRRSARRHWPMHCMTRFSPAWAPCS
jgi:hypothetical protein